MIISYGNKEKYSRGRRGAPAKGVGRETGARVQIPLSPFTASSMTAQQTPELSDSGTQSRTEFIWPAERKWISSKKKFKKIKKVLDKQNTA